MGNSNTIFSVIVLSLLILSVFSASTSARESFNQTQAVRDGETLVSETGIFVLGFFNPGSSNNRYLGIWYNFSTDTVVWVANRQNPIKDSFGVLKITSSGNLTIMQDQATVSDNTTSVVVWSSNSTTPKGSNSIINPVAKLLDSGNLVVFNEPDGVLIWQSFDYPVDTLLQGMKNGIDLKSGHKWYLMSWKSEDDPSIGVFTSKLDSSGAIEFYVTNRGKTIHRSGHWNGHYWNGNPRMIANSKDIKYIFTNNQTEVSYGFEIIPKGMFSHLKLYSNGTFVRNVWTSDTSRWTSYENPQGDECDTYNRCGPNGVCDIQGLELCQCHKGFRPKLNSSWTNREFTQGCVRNEKLNCSKGEGFFRVIRVKLPETLDATVDKSMSLKGCRIECLSNCSCMAYAALYLSDINPRGCIMWFGDLLDTKLFTNGGQDMFLRLPHSELPNSPSGKNNKVIFIVVGVLVGLLFTVLCWILYSWRKKKFRAIQRVNKYKENSSKYWKDELRVFDFTTIASMTCNFSSENVIGQGGFGIVYKGRMADGQDIAVKRLLKNTSGQGVDEFMNEVTLIAKLQHRNLVRLLGCCMEGDERILVFEFMRNKSLDSIIFGESKKLDWRKRVEIITGIARGLLYLHQDSRFRIIHRDLKAGNVLLDEAMNPKISDFGTARIFGADQMEENTKRVIGTYGYMSPEYAMNGIFSIKSDVFSFGVLLLEIISGKKNRVFYQEEHELTLLAMAWKLWKDGRSLELVDETMGSSCPTSEVLRCIQIGLLCVQNRAIDRPSMLTVVFMLNSDNSPLSEPKKPGFSENRTTIAKYMSGRSSSHGQVPCTINEVTLTDVEGR